MIRGSIGCALILFGFSVLIGGCGQGCQDNPETQAHITGRIGGSGVTEIRVTTALPGISDGWSQSVHHPLDIRVIGVEHSSLG